MAEKLFDMVVSIMKRCQMTEEKIKNEFALSTAEYNGLMAMIPGEKILCNVLSKRMELSPSRGSRVAERLVRKGYVRSSQVPNDRRSLELSLTKKGSEMRHCIEEKLHECEERMLSTLSQSEQDLVRQGLILLTAVF
ncbi:MAG: MarR family transcriptional regulator [candidate division WOR-3 bacterium]|nr:MAG: MarR family transcriptional regulator [candidate division WOR-3 bacterium]